MRTDIVNGSIVTGDGESLLENTSLIIRDGLIEDLPPVRYIPYNAYADRVIDAGGGLIIPGVINLHSHGISFGPFFPYAWKRLSEEKVLNSLDAHLLQGTTTMLNNDGIALPSEVEAVNKIHPVNIRTCTLHTSGNIRAAEAVAGEGIEDRHRRFTAEAAVAAGAVAIGEVGSPGTSYGTYEKGLRVGKVIETRHALALDRAVLAEDDGAIRRALVVAGLEEMTIEEARTLVYETSVIPVEACCDAIRESVTYVRKLGVPVLAHSEPWMKDAILEAAKELGPRMIAVHVNHSFPVEESLAFARTLKDLGATVEIITADSFGARQVEPTPASAFALLREDLVDVITTDYSGGYHDPILLVLQKAIEEGVLALPRAIQLATSAAAETVPGVAPNRGYIAPAKVADLCIVDRDDLSKVRYVIIGGRTVVEDGRLVPAAFANGKAGRTKGEGWA
jgi:imidazolonepropionase-like amidohydrolase